MNGKKLLVLALLLPSIGIIVYVVWPYLLCALIIVCMFSLAVETANKMKQAGYTSIVSVTVPVLVATVGTGLGCVYLGSSVLILMGSAPLVAIAIYPQFQYRRLVANYKRNYRHLIQP